MPAPASVNELLELIRKSGVVEEARLTAYMQKLHSLSSSVPKEPNKIAGFMVRDGILTYFQAEQFLQGKWKRFTIGKYKVLEKLGSGGMGQVFLCEHKLMRRRVAVKVLPTAKAEDPSSLERFYREARAAAALDHQNIVRAYDIDQDDNLHFLVMEFVDGSSFQDIIKKSGPMDVLRACHYIYWAAIGMQHAHEQGIIHRDIKPGNILVDRMGVVKILDMGLARFFHDDEDLITKKFDENVLGTADYLAPEQALDSHTVDGRADIYSLGATFYFLLTGGPPFVEGTVAQKLIWHQNREPKPLKNQRPDLPDGVVKIIAKMMAKDPNNRFQTPAELAATLGPWIQTPIAPPPESEMPMLCPAVLAAGTGMVTTTSAASKGLPSTSGNSTGGSVSRRPSMSAVNLAPIPTPPLSGSGKQPTQLVAEIQPTGSGRGIAESLPSAEVEAPAGENDWANFADTNNASRGDTGRKPASSRRKTPPTPKPIVEVEDDGSRPPVSRSKMWLWIGLGLLVIGGAIGLVFLVSGGGSNSNQVGPRPVEGPRTILVSKQTPVNVAELKVDSITRAFEIARAKDTIIIQDEEWTENLRIEGAKKDLTLCPAEGKRVVWKSGDAKDAIAVFSIANAENLTVHSIDFHGRGITPAVVQINGNCPGLVLKDLELIDGKEYDLRFVDCTGEAARPVSINHVKFTTTGTTNFAVALQGSGTKQGNSFKQSAFIRVEGCRMEGAFRSAAFLIDGAATDIELTRNRVWQSAGGVWVKRKNPEHPIRFVVGNNTFHTMAQSLVRFDLGDPPLDATAPTRYKFDFVANFLFNTGNPVVISGDAKPLPPPTVLLSTNNARNAPADPTFATLPVLTVQIPTDPKNDETFLRSDSLKAVGPTKVPVGATGP